MTSKVALLIPCYNEETTVRKVIRDFRAELPGATLYVFDNASTDGTARAAEAEGATVIHVPQKGKGHVVQKMLRTLTEDYCVMVDGDDTYPAAAVTRLLDPVISGRADMVVGNRLAGSASGVSRRFHRFGNRLVVGLINVIFRSRIQDAMSGYRAFSLDLAKTLPLRSLGFEIETEITTKCLYYHFHLVEVPIEYRERPEGSHSKLNTYRDGFKVLYTITQLLKNFKPLTFFGGIGLALLGLGAAILPVNVFVAGFLGIFGLVIGFSGLILTTINARISEIYSVLRRQGPHLGAEFRSSSKVFSSASPTPVLPPDHKEQVERGQVGEWN